MLVISWKRAMGMIYGRNNAEVISFYSDSFNDDMAVLRLLYRDFPAALRKKISNPKISKRKVIARDCNKCVYCDATNDITIDHVMPKSRGGPNTYENCVAACYSCNNKKGNRTPAEAGMALPYKPRRPKFGIAVSKHKAPPEWKDFLIF